MKVLFSILLTAVALAGCRTSRQIESQLVTSDSLQTWSEETRWEDSIPGATVSIHLPSDTLSLLTRLPEGFGLMKKQNTLGLDVVSDGKGGLTVTANVPDVKQRVYYKRRETTRGKKTTSESRTEQVKKPASSSVWLIVSLLLLTVLAVGYIFMKLKSKNNSNYGR